MFKLALASIVVATVAARPDGPHPAHAPAYGAPPPAYHPAPVEYDEPPKYAFTYAVKDDYTYTNFDAAEQRDGYETTGSYRVALPDGRTQIVTYSAGKGGYVADVSYEGEAKFPEYKPTYKVAPAPAYKAAPAPAYKAAPAYAPAPAYKAAPAYAPAPAYKPAPVVYKPTAIKYTTAAPEAEVKAAEPAAVVEEAAAPAEEAAPVEEAAAPAEEKAAPVEA